MSNNPHVAPFSHGYHHNVVTRALETHEGRLQVLYADTVTDVPNARAYQANRKIYPESYSDVGTNVHTKQTL